MSEGVVAGEGVIAQEESTIATALELPATVIELAPPLDAESPRRKHWPRGQLLARLTLAGLLFSLTGVLLSAQVSIEGVNLLALTTGISAIWFVAQLRGARLAGEPIVASAIGTGFGLIAVTLVDFWILNLAISPKELLAMSGCVFTLGAGFQTIASRGLKPVRRVIVLSPDEDAYELIRELREEHGDTFECIGIVEEASGDGSSNGVPLLGSPADLVEILKRERAAVLVCSNGTYNGTIENLLDIGMTSINVLDPLEFREHAFRRVESKSVTATWFGNALVAHRQRYSSRTKRGFDIIAATIALVLAAPLMLVIPLLVRASGRGPILFRQVRVGEGGKPFQMLKFRTMVVDAEAGEAVWASENDPRITPVGRVLRKMRLDELPQLWNVVRGEMSVVGPRPERPEFLAVLGEHVPYWKRRDLLKPGITGWAQVHYDYTADISGAATKLSYDLYYLKHRSLALDILILLKTIRVVFLGRGR